MVSRPNIGSNTEMARPQVFDGILGKIPEFVMACRLYKNEDERRYSRGTDSVDIVIYTRRIGRYVEGEYFGRFESRTIGI